MTISIYFLNIKSRKLKDLKNRERGGDHHGAALPRVSPVRSARTRTRSSRVTSGGAGGQAVTHNLLTTSIGRGDQAPAVYRKIPVYRDWTQIPIPGFLKLSTLSAVKSNGFF